MANAFFSPEGTLEQITKVLASTHNLVKIFHGVLVKEDARPIRAGEQIAISTDTKKAFGRKSTQLAAATTTSDTTIEVDDAHNFEVGDSIDIGAQVDKEITAINYDTNVITIGTTVGGAESIDARVHVSENEENKAKAIALTPVKDRENSALANRHGEFVYGDLAERGVFVKTAIKDFNSESDTDLGGADGQNGTYYIK